MMKLFQPFLGLLANSTDQDLAHMVAYLKEENRILREKLPKRIAITTQERSRLVKLGAKLGKALKGLIGIVSYRTFRRWLAKTKQTPVEQKVQQESGRPKTDEVVRQLVLKLASENDWGYSRILGELKKLGVKLSKSTVKNILKENGFDPGPKRGKGSWSEFVMRHAKTLWATDFFSKKVVTWCGVIEIYILFFINVETRRVHLAGITAHPDKQWMVQQPRNVAMFFAEQEDKPTHLLRDRDSKFVKEFDAIFESEGIEVKPVGPLAPNMNAYAERWILSVKSECLDHFICFGEEHLRHILTCYLEHYHLERPHQGKGNVPLTGETPEPATPLRLSEVVCEERLGGLLKHYRRAA